MTRGPEFFMMESLYLQEPTMIAAPTSQTPAPELPRWMVATLETTGWAIYLGALGVLGSFGLVVCRALLY